MRQLFNIEDKNPCHLLYLLTVAKNEGNMHLIGVLYYFIQLKPNILTDGKSPQYNLV